MANIDKDNQNMEFPLQIARQYGAPLDKYSLFYSMAEAEEYAANSPLAYVGQLISVVNETDKTVDIYKINADGTLGGIGGQVDTSDFMRRIDTGGVQFILEHNTKKEIINIKSNFSELNVKIGNYSVIKLNFCCRYTLNVKYFSLFLVVSKTKINSFTVERHCGGNVSDSVFSGLFSAYLDTETDTVKIYANNTLGNTSLILINCEAPEKCFNDKIDYEITFPDTQIDAIPDGAVTVTIANLATNTISGVTRLYTASEVATDDDDGAATPAAVTKILQAAIAGGDTDFAPVNHASANDTYGRASYYNYGHVKLTVPESDLVGDIRALGVTEINFGTSGNIRLDELAFLCSGLYTFSITTISQQEKIVDIPEEWKTSPGHYILDIKNIGAYSVQTLYNYLDTTKIYIRYTTRLGRKEWEKIDFNSTSVPGPQGEPGANGVTFTPSVSTAGLLSWTNNGGLANPASVNIKGPQGIQGEQGSKGDKGDKGDTGATGPQGEQGPSYSLYWHIYTLEIADPNYGVTFEVEVGFISTSSTASSTTALQQLANTGTIYFYSPQYSDAAGMNVIYCGLHIQKSLETKQSYLLIQTEMSGKYATANEFTISTSNLTLKNFGRYKITGT